MGAEGQVAANRVVAVNKVATTRPSLKARIKLLAGPIAEPGIEAPGISQTLPAAVVITTIGGEPRVGSVSPPSPAPGRTRSATVPALERITNPIENLTNSTTKRKRKKKN